MKYLVFKYIISNFRNFKIRLINHTNFSKNYFLLLNQSFSVDIFLKIHQYYREQ